MPTVPGGAAGDLRSNPHLRLLGAFQLILNHRVVPVTIGSQRLIAFLALHDRLLPRMYIAGVLWPEVPTGRANANLRAGLWRLPEPCRRVVDQSSQGLRLADITVDLRDATVLAQQLLDRTQHCAKGDLGICGSHGVVRRAAPDLV